MKYNKKDIKKGIRLHKINIDKFKTNLIAVFLSTELTRENVTFNAVLSSVLRRGSQNYKTQEEISKKLEEMYGAEFDCGVNKIGKNHVLKFYIETINDDFLPNNGENMLKESIKLISEIIFNPQVDEKGFNSEYVEQEKENIKQIIEAKKDNKASYSAFRCLEEMYKGKPAGLYKYGYVEDMEKINSSTLYEYYKNLIDNCKIDIFISGKLEDENVDIDEQKINELKDREATYKINKTEIKKAKEKEDYVEESMEVNQGKLVIGYDIDIDENMAKDENLRYIGMVYNGILGGSANSKLFQNVRERASLAYTTNSSYGYYNGNIFVSAGIDIENYQKAVDIIKEQIKDMENSNFNNEDIANAKKVIISNIEAIDDEQDTEIIYFLGQELSGKNVLLEEYIKRVENVTKEQIENFAKKIKTNTIYFLRD